MEFILFLLGWLLGYIVGGGNSPVKADDTVIAKPKASRKSCDKYGYCDRDYLQV